jgi:phosphoglycolate phosphatase
MTGGLLFDFDGTLVDTFDDIVEAVQRARRRLDGEPLDPREVRHHIGWGARNLMGLCHPKLDRLRPAQLPEDGARLPIPSEEIDEALRLFRQEYSRILLRQTRPYAGMPEVCWALARDGLSLAVISNKPERFVRQLLAGLALADPFRLIVGGDTLGRAKPDPEPLRHALRCLGLPPQRCIMIGDGRLDLLAARAAGIASCAVTWGLSTEEELIPLGPAHLARTPRELEAWLRKALRAMALQN